MKMMSWTAVDHVHTNDVGRTTQYGFIKVLMGFGVDLSALLLFLLIYIEQKLRMKLLHLKWVLVVSEQIQNYI